MECPGPRGTEAPNVQLGSERTEHKPTRLQRQRSTLDPITVFADWSSDAERPLRQRIYRARDKANALTNRSKHIRARTLYREAAGIANDWVFCRASIEDLKDVIKIITHLFAAARLVAEFEAPDNWCGSGLNA